MVDADEDDTGDVEPVKFMWSEAAGAGLNFAADLARSVAELFGHLTVIAMRHSAYVVDRDTAYERMHADIEALPETSEVPNG